MERLTARLDDGRAYLNTHSEKTNIYQHEENNPIEKLADYEDAEEQGRLIEFPVAIGQHLWRINSYPYGIFEIVVTNLQTSGKGNLFAHGREIETGHDHYFALANVGKTTFTTRAEAEAKLKEMEDEDAENHKTE